MKSPQHRLLVSSLVSKLAYSCEVKYAAGVGTLPEPPKIGRHEPDVIASANGRLVIGEAKLGPDLTDQTTREQLEDFCSHAGPDGEIAAFWLCVPDGWRQQAEEAIETAGGTLGDHADILTVSFPDTASSPRDPTSDQ